MDNLIQLPDKTKDLILSNFQINDAIPITQEQGFRFPKKCHIKNLWNLSLEISSCTYVHIEKFTHTVLSSQIEL